MSDTPTPPGTTAGTTQGTAPETAAALGAPHIKLELLSQPRLLSAARALVANLAERLGFDGVQCGQITLAVDEALCNVINHGYGRRGDQPIWINVWAVESNAEPGENEAAWLRIMIEDNARQVEPASIRSRDLEDVRPGGLGVYIIREIMDEVHFEKREGQGMRLTMSKRLDPAPKRPKVVDENE